VGRVLGATQGGVGAVVKIRAVYVDMMTKKQREIDIEPKVFIRSPDEIGAGIQWGAFPEYEYRNGENVLIGGYVISLDEADVLPAIIYSAEHTLENGTQYEIRKMIPYNFGRTKGLCWYRNSQMDKETHWYVKTPYFDAPTGVYILMRRTVGSNS